MVRGLIKLDGTDCLAESIRTIRFQLLKPFLLTKKA
jgi:hypothetical protein